jgi:hypothetical protein
MLFISASPKNACNDGLIMMHDRETSYIMSEPRLLEFKYVTRKND